MQDLAKENIELTVEQPKQLKILAVSQPDSAFGVGYFTKEEVKGMIRAMQTVSDTIMKRIDNMKRFNPDDSYVISLDERQMKGMSEIRSLMSGGGKKGQFSGWKVKVDYSCVDKDGVPYHAERWCFIDKDGKQVFRTLELPLS